LRSVGHVLVGLASLGVLLPVLAFFSLFAPGPLPQDTTLIIAHGASASDIGGQLRQADAVYATPLFRVAARLMAGNVLKAGEYIIPKHASMITIAQMIRDGKSVVRLFTVAEGLTSAEIVDALRDEPVLTGTIDSIPAEGTLLPETYRYMYGDSRTGILARMTKAMQDKEKEIWDGREEGLPIDNLSAAVILASIVEKETGKAEERPRIAGVFYNRLRQNMRLQSDPTVIYALTRGKSDLDRVLTHEDLSIASPFNTYVSNGLPPQPICNPGIASLQAVTHPEHHAFLYFVADGNGGHAFAADLATHDQNINRWHQMQQSAGHP